MNTTNPVINRKEAKNTPVKFVTKPKYLIVFTHETNLPKCNLLLSSPVPHMSNVTF